MTANIAYNIKFFNSLSLASKYPILFSFYNDLSKSNNINPQKGCTKDKTATVSYMTLSDAKKIKLL